MIMKEILFLLSFIAAAMISRVEYNEYVIKLQSGDPAVLVTLIPDTFTLILSSFIVYIVLYTLFRWWVWSGYSDVKWNYLLVNSFMVLPFIFLCIIVLALAAVTVQVYTAVWNGYLRIFTLFLGSIFVYYGRGSFMAYLQGFNMLGKNPWYNVYDALAHIFSKRTWQLCIVYTVPAIISLLAALSYANPAWVPVVTWGAYLYARQYVVSKKKTVWAYTRYIGHYYHKKVHTIYKKIVRA